MGSFTLRDKTMWYRTHDSLITFNNGLGPLKTKSGGGLKGDVLENVSKVYVGTYEYILIHVP